MDVSVFFTLSLEELQGVCGHDRAFPRMSERKDNNTDARVNTVSQTHHSLTLSSHMLVLFLQVILQEGWDCQGYLEGVLITVVVKLKKKGIQSFFF